MIDRLEEAVIVVSMKRNETQEQRIAMVRARIAQQRAESKRHNELMEAAIKEAAAYLASQEKTSQTSDKSCSTSAES